MLGSMKPITKPIEAFKPGRHTAMSGTVLEYSDADLAGCAAAYDPAVYRAPIVVGHPKLPDPAYGYVDNLQYADSLLCVTGGEVDPDFADVVDRKYYTQVSASFWLPNSPNNPKPGTLYLRHIGFLGATPPAIKGLKAAEFGEADEEGVVTFADWNDVQNASLWRRLRDWIIGKHGLDEADKVIPDYAVASLEEEARRESPEALSPAFADNQETTVSPEEVAALQAENARLKSEQTARQEADRKAVAAARHADHVSFAEALVGDAKLAAKHKDVLVAALDHLAAPVGDAVVEFGEGEARKPLIDQVKALLGDLPAEIEFGEVATHQRANSAAGVVDFAAPAGLGVDSAQLALHGRVQAYAAKHNVTYDAALAVVSKQ